MRVSQGERVDAYRLVKRDTPTGLPVGLTRPLATVTTSP